MNQNINTPVKDIFFQTFKDSAIAGAELESIIESADIETVRLEVLELKACCDLFLKRIENCTK